MEIRTLARQREALTAPADIGALKTVFQIVQDAGPLEKQLAETRSDITAQEQNLNQALRRQDLWRGGLEALGALPLPSLASIDQFEDRLDALARQIDNHQAAQAKREDELSRIDTELQAIATSRDVPTEEDLKDARDRRERAGSWFAGGWKVVPRIRRKKTGTSRASPRTMTCLSPSRPAYVTPTRLLTVFGANPNRSAAKVCWKPAAPAMPASCRTWPPI
jgi:hypothetical protein